MDKTHKYSLEIKWTGNTGSGTSGYRSYKRSHSIIKGNKSVGTMHEMPDGSRHFTEVNLFPVVSVTEESMFEKANHLHERAHEQCFIANSCNF